MSGVCYVVFASEWGGDDSVKAVFTSAEAAEAWMAPEIARERRERRLPDNYPEPYHIERFPLDPEAPASMPSV